MYNRQFYPHTQQQTNDNTDPNPNLTLLMTLNRISMILTPILVTLNLVPYDTG